MVLLRHDLPDGSHHFDWLIERQNGEELLVTFRVAVRLDLLREGRFEAARLQDHRRAYLDYQGAVSGERGWVERVASGSVKSVELTPGLAIIHGSLGEVAGCWRGVESGGTWLFEVSVPVG